MNSEIKITCDADRSATIDIEGRIGVPEQAQEYGSDDAVSTYAAFRHALDRIVALDVRKITVNIRSTGGSVADALLIYDALRASGATVTTRCFGSTASAATVIAQAASEGRREISPTALYLVHRSISTAEGNAVEMQQSVDLFIQPDEVVDARSFLRLRPAALEAGKADAQLDQSRKGRTVFPEIPVETLHADSEPTAPGRCRGRPREIHRGISVKPDHFQAMRLLATPLVEINPLILRQCRPIIL